MRGRVFESTLLITLLALVVVSVTGHAQLSGNSRLDIVAFPIPCSVIDIFNDLELCEQTLLKFDIESILVLNVTVSGLLLSINSSIGIAGPEHFIISGVAMLGSVTIRPEIWFAVPFETVTDLNGISNIVVVPPGEVMFVKKRVVTELNIAGVNIRNLAMFEDVTFPNPNAAFEPDFYPPQSQSFGFGDIVSVSGQTVSGLNVSITAAFCATQASNQVKKFSASGSVNPLCAQQGIPLSFDFASVSVSNITISGLSLSQTMAFRPGVVPPFTLSTGVSFSVFDIARVSTSITTNPLSLGNISVAILADTLRLNLRFDDSFQLASASTSLRVTLSVGSLTLSLSTSLSFRAEQGLTSVGLSLFLAQGTFSAAHSVSYIRQQTGVDLNGDPIFGLKFGSFSMALTFRLSPAVVSVRATFGQTGLTRLAIGIGVVF